MYSTLLSRALFAATTVSGVLATFSIETPQLTQCQDATISWSSGTGPYYVLVVNPEEPCGEPILDLGTFSATSFTWNVALQGGSSIELYVEDSGPNEAWGGRVTILKSDDSSCLSQDGLSTPTASTPTSTPSAISSPDQPQDQDSTYVVHTPATHKHIPSSSPSPNPSPSGTPPSDIPPSDTPSGLVPIGAANAGTNPLSSGASSMPRAGAPITTIFATFAAAIALAL